MTGELSEAEVRIARDQFRLAKEPHPKLPCGGCEGEFPIRFLYRCLYCGIWYCRACGKEHFGPNEQPTNGGVSDDEPRADGRG